MVKNYVQIAIEAAAGENGIFTMRSFVQKLCELQEIENIGWPDLVATMLIANPGVSMLGGRDMNTRFEWVRPEEPE